MSIYLLVNTNQPIIEGLLPGGSGIKESAGNAEHLRLTPGLGRSPGEENGNPFQYSGLENSMDRGAWQVRVHGVAKSQIWLNNFHFHFIWFMKILCIILGYNPAATICLWGFSTSPATSSNSHTADNSHTSTCPGTLPSHPLHSVWVGGGCWDYLMSTYIDVKEFMMHLLLLFIW